MTVIATAGHVDHGKSTLVRVLTGIDPDRLAEEQARGLTIDLGFAATTLPSGVVLEFVDVPGHVRFLRNMLAGVGSVSCTLFVVAANEGWKPQSEEHLRILELVGVSRGVVALTNIDRLEPDRVADARHEIAAHFAGTFLESAPIIDVAAPLGIGIDQLRDALEHLVVSEPVTAGHGRTRMWIDRCFAATGSGTVVTGTLTGGTLSVGENIDVAGSTVRPVRVRALQTRHASVLHVDPGQRCAVNLAGVAYTDIARGHALIRQDEWHHTTVFDASMAVLASLSHGLTRRGAFSVYIGSAELSASVRIIGGDAIEAGNTGAVRVRIAAPMPLVPGDRFVLRETGRAETVGGGEILDVDPILTVRAAHPDRSTERVVAERGWILPSDLERLTGTRAAPNVGDWVVDPTALDIAVERLTDTLLAAGSGGLASAAMSERDRAIASLLDDVVEAHGTLRHVRHVDVVEHQPFVDALQSTPFAPPDPPDDVHPGMLHQLKVEGFIVSLDGIWFAASAIEAAIDEITTLLTQHPDGFTVSDARSHLGTSRKFALPLLGHLDALAITRRDGDRRVAGPRLVSRGRPRVVQDIDNAVSDQLG